MRYKRQVNASDSVSCCYSVLRSDFHEFQRTQTVNSRLPRRTYLIVLDMSQTETPKWRGTLSCCFEVYWFKMLKICARKHIFQGGSSGHFLRQLRQLLFCTLIHMQRWWFCSPKQAPPQFRWSCITPDKKVNPSLPTS